MHNSSHPTLYHDRYSLKDNISASFIKVQSDICKLITNFFSFFLALIGAIYPRIEKDALDRIFLPTNGRASVKHDNQSYFKACLKKSINLQEKERKLYNFL